MFPITTPEIFSMKHQTRRINSRFLHCSVVLFSILILLLTGVYEHRVNAQSSKSTVRVTTFEVDATPPIGSPLAYTTLEEKVKPLRAKGIAILTEARPIVICAVDWIGIANEGQTAWKKALAKAADTEPKRVAVHALHQHEAPRCDFSARRLLRKHDTGIKMFNAEHARNTIDSASDALKKALKKTKRVSHVGFGKGVVRKIASNRRILAETGKVKDMRWTATADPELRAEPAGVVDGYARMVSFWNGEKPVVTLSYFATHPQSYYRTGGVNPDFPGIARAKREEETGVPHLYFTGAAGNIGAGKWNDGSHENRQKLANRLAAGLKRAWRNQRKQKITPEKVRWLTESVALPPANHLSVSNLQQVITDDRADRKDRINAAKSLAWLRQRRNGETISAGCLQLGNVRILHLPGELAVQYQLAAQAMAPDQFVALAAYGEYAPGYINLAHHYWQGGYEASHGASRVAPKTEIVLMKAMQRLLHR